MKTFFAEILTQLAGVWLYRLLYMSTFRVWSDPIIALWVLSVLNYIENFSFWISHIGCEKLLLVSVNLQSAGMKSNSLCKIVFLKLMCYCILNRFIEWTSSVNMIIFLSLACSKDLFVNNANLDFKCQKQLIVQVFSLKS